MKGRGQASFLSTRAIRFLVSVNFVQTLFGKGSSFPKQLFHLSFFVVVESNNTFYHNFQLYYYGGSVAIIHRIVVS